MSATTIVLEVENLHAVSSRLDALADQHPVVSEGLLAISASIRDNASLLAVLVTTKMGLQ